MQTQSDFFDVERLIERSMPVRGLWVLGYAAGIILLVLISSAYFSEIHPAWSDAAGLLSTFVLVLIVLGMLGMSVYANHRRRSEQLTLEALEELIQLRRWQEAAGVINQYLSKPTCTHMGRIQGLIYLSMVLMRYHQFEQAINVQNYIFEHVQLDPGTEYGVKLSRAMAMLREDHLVDADRAIGELRRMSGGDSGALALLELYRDVKTGHPAEAVEIFSSKLKAMKEQLGHRVADAYALGSKAMRMLGRTEEGEKLWEDATTLVAANELVRRYPELAA